MWQFSFYLHLHLRFKEIENLAHSQHSQEALISVGVGTCASVCVYLPMCMCVHACVWSGVEEESTSFSLQDGAAD